MRIAGQGGHSLRAGFVVAQMSLAILLLVGATLLVKSFRAVVAIHPGFRPEHLLTMEYRLPRNKYPNAAAQWNFHRTMLARVREVPGVNSSALVQALPMSGNWGELAFSIPRQTSTITAKASALVNLVSPDYFSTVGTPLLRGRGFTEDDRLDTARVAIVGRTLAEKYWPGQDPIGQEILFNDSNPGGKSQEQHAAVVGVVADVKQIHLREAARPLIYFPYSQSPAIFGTLVVRSAGDPAALTDAIRRAVWTVDKDQPVWRVRTVATVLADQMASEKMMMWLVSAFGGLALLLSMIGAYGLLSNAVNQRRQEIGIRMALGAEPNVVLRLVLQWAVRLTLTGGILGIAAGLMATRFMASVLYGVSAADVSSFALGWGLMTVAAILASYLPARRASRVDPVVALRYE
jgi:putative ABC transport system permease protein